MTALVSKQMAKDAKPVGKVPGVLLIDPKFPRNVGTAIRTASSYGVGQVWYTGNRVKLDDGKRLPREERMKGYKNVDLIQNDYPFDCFPKGVVPVAIEVRENSVPLFNFEHPENALYVFGPEDGSVPSQFLRHCHHFVIIPTRHCLNLGTAVSTVLYDRSQKQYQREYAEAMQTTGQVPDFVTPGHWERRGLDATLFPDDEDA